MSLSEAGLCNLALVRIGQRQLIDSLEEASVEAQTCKAVYASARDAVLGEFWWPFATKRATLALITDGERDGWEYAYSLPADCIADGARYLWSGLRDPPAESRIPFTTESNDAGDGLILLTDEEDAILVYTYAVTLPGLFPPLFVQALAWKVASELALGLPIKPQVGLAMDQKYRAALATAMTASARARQLDAPDDAESIRARS